MSGGRSSSSNATSQTTNTVDAKQTADGQAVVARADGGDVIINQTLDDAVLIAEDAFRTADNAVAMNGDAVARVLDFAQDTTTGVFSLQEDNLDTIAVGFEQALSTTIDANRRSLDVVSQGFEQALAESREDDTQLLSQLITFAIPAAVLLLLWRASN